MLLDIVILPFKNLINWDTKLFYAVNNLTHHSAFLDRLAAAANKYSLVLFGLILVWYFFKNRRAFWTAFWSAFLARGVFTILIRYFFPRTRPFVLLENVNRLVPQDPKEASLPSGHTATFFAIALAVYLYDKRAGSVLFILALLLSVNRIFVGVHYPLDIVAGIIVAAVSVWIVRKFMVKKNK